MQIELAVSKLNALAQESRLSIFQLLMKNGSKSMNASSIAKATSILPNTLSFHLKELQQAGLVLSEKSGRSVFYSLNTAGYSELLHFLTYECCLGHPEMCKPFTKISKLQ